MNLRRVIPVTLHVLAGILSLFASMFGGISIFSGVNGANTALLWLYCIPLMLLLPFFCVSFLRPRISAALQLLAGIVFVTASVLINIHACAGNGGCPGTFSVTVSSILDPSVITPFLIAALQTLSIYVRNAEPARQNAGRII
ncbi:MAG TPA: hypothetical protein VF730_07555 [Terracidiphilus sp.]